MTQLPSDIELAKDYIELYASQLRVIEVKLRAISSDEKMFDALFGEALVVHRLMVSTERTWRDALREELVSARAKADTWPFRRPRRRRQAR